MHARYTRYLAFNRVCRQAPGTVPRTSKPTLLAYSRNYSHPHSARSTLCESTLLKSPANMHGPAPKDGRVEVLFLNVPLGILAAMCRRRFTVRLHGAICVHAVHVEK